MTEDKKLPTQSDEEKEADDFLQNAHSEYAVRGERGTSTMEKDRYVRFDRICSISKKRCGVIAVSFTASSMMTTIPQIEFFDCRKCNVPQRLIMESKFLDLQREIRTLKETFERWR